MHRTRFRLGLEEARERAWPSDATGKPTCSARSRGERALGRGVLQHSRTRQALKPGAWSRTEELARLHTKLSPGSAVENRYLTVGYEFSTGPNREQPGATKSTNGRGFRLGRVAPGPGWFVVVW